MNKGAVRAGRVAQLYRQGVRRRGAAVALDLLNRALDAGRGSPFLRRFIVEEAGRISNAAYRAIKPFMQRETRLQQRRNAFYATRLARTNGWGSAGKSPVEGQCPANVAAKTPAVHEQVCRVAAVGAGTTKGPRRVARALRRTHASDRSACLSASQQAGGGVP